VVVVLLMARFPELRRFRILDLPPPDLQR